MEDLPHSPEQESKALRIANILRNFAVNFSEAFQTGGMGILFPDLKNKKRKRD
jgi:hypothetical protein